MNSIKNDEAVAGMPVTSSSDSVVKSGTYAMLKRLAAVVVWTSALYTIYQATNRYHLFPPVTLPMTPLDRAIPFWTWTVVPYFLLIAGMYLPALIKDVSLFKRTLAAITIGVLINYTIFLLWPTTYPRPPLPDGDRFYDNWYRWLTVIDTPANCFPSGHITAPAIGVWAVSRQYPRWRWPLLILFGFLSVTILTTKQHYIWDLFGGLVTAAIGIVSTSKMSGRQLSGS